MNAFVAIRLRGHVHVRDTIEVTMESLNLTRPNHAVIVPGTPGFLGMLRKVKDYVTYGTVDAPMVEKLLRARGRLEGDKPLTDAHVKENTAYGSIKELAAALADGSIVYKTVPGVKPIFRLSPPRKGFKGGVKRSWQAHGALGNRGAEMGTLVERMM